ncbi:hypothetical protein H5410_058941 [Solanum commersonii]|uniref:Uncharacterized protein n=1 Tax=Solanum commersonii TaxID=4109 RepID=A0A9J5W1D1_SOLCO|nr:hypothetical protein H5410_058941 [Solanum commersonii]
MKLTKSMLSPSHARHDPPLTLPTSLSRRLKANGSIKGGQSPATFPTTTGKKRGSGFDNPEPSSPKVTCIGQVKMKTKKKVRQTRNLSNRRSDISFRKLEEERGVLIQNQRSSSVHLQAQDQCAAAVAVAHRNQRWVHLPVTIYEALREFSCLFPCRSSCFSNEKGKQEDKVNGSREVDNNNNGQRRCEDVVARWLVALQDGEADEKTRGIELVVTNNVKEEEDEKMEQMQSTMRSSRRHVFEGIEFKDHDDGSVEMKEEKARVSICIPPKNALLLMRCRSDPMKMADITNRFWESPAREETNEEDKKEIEENAEVEEVVDTENIECKVLQETSCVSVDLVENEENAEAESSKDEEKLKCHELTPETEEQDEEESVIKALVAAAAVEVNSIVDQTKNQLLESEKKEEEEDSSIQSFSSFSENEEDETLDEEQEEERFKSIIKKVIEETLLLEHIDRADAKQIQHEHREEEEAKSDATFSNNEIEKESRKQQNESILPDCLLLMMCEPKLSMEVSKETWVYSSTELKQAKTVTKKKKKNEIPEDPKRRRSIDKSKQQHLLLQPPRSSCSFPVTGVSPAMSMATMIEQKLVNSVADEPLVLTRCKSEPMRTAAGVTAKLVPETCFWKNMKIEPHRRATFGFGAAGVGF